MSVDVEGRALEVNQVPLRRWSRLEDGWAVREVVFIAVGGEGVAGVFCGRLGERVALASGPCREAVRRRWPSGRAVIRWRLRRRWRWS